MPGDIEARIRENIVADFNGQPYPGGDGTAHAPEAPRLGIGAAFYASRFYCPAISAGAADVIAVTIAAGGGAPGNYLELNYDQYLTLDPADIAVTVEAAQ